MVHILGVQLADHRPARIALTGIYGIGKSLALRVLARLSIPQEAKLTELTSAQMTALTSFLSAPGNAPPRPYYKLASLHPHPKQPLHPRPPQQQQQPRSPQQQKGTTGEKKKETDPLKKLMVESDLKRYMRENILHHKQIGSYVGRRHAMHLPVRGQRTRTNFATARKLNRIERLR